MTALVPPPGITVPPLTDQVHVVPPGEMLDPPYCPQLPPGTLPIGQASSVRCPAPDELTVWLSRLGLPKLHYIRRDGIYLHRLAHADRYFVSVDYQHGGSWVNDPAEGRAGLRLNYEAGRCHHDHPLALEVALDRRFAEVGAGQEPHDALRGTFDRVPAGPRRGMRDPEWVAMLLQYPG